MVFLIFVLLFVFIYVGVYLWASFTPKLSIDGANGYYLYDSNGKLYTGSASEDWIGLESISQDLKNATISTEDKNFYKHRGFDYLRIFKALFINIKSRENLQGASTITQQYTKNLFLNFDKTFERKFKEALLTVRVETHYSKDEILEGYLNTINYGGIFGIENASRYYFGKSASELSLAESSMLAGIPKNPGVYSPFVNEKKAKQRQWVVLNSMVSNKYITDDEAKKAFDSPLNYKTDDGDDNFKMIKYYQDAVLEELEQIDSIPSSFLETGGLKIYTNLDTNAY